MGAITTKQYKLYKEVKQTQYGDCRIPVGMPEALWRAKLAQQQLDAQMSHASWAAKRIAYWAETCKRIDARRLKPMRVAWLNLTPLSIDDFLSNDSLMTRRFRALGVREVLIPATILLTRELVEKAGELA